MKAGMLAAEAAFKELTAGSEGKTKLAAYTQALRGSWVYKDLHKVRNVKPGMQWGTALGTLHAGIHMQLKDLQLGFLVPWTLQHKKPDHATLKPADQCTRIAYPKPDGRITFGRLSSVFISNTNHEENQPCISGCAILPFRSPPILPCSMHPSSAIVPPVCTRQFSARIRPAPRCRSMPRTAYTARRAISRPPSRTSTGLCPREGTAPTTSAYRSRYRF